MYQDKVQLACETMHLLRVFRNDNFVCSQLESVVSFAGRRGKHNCVSTKRARELDAHVPSHPSRRHLPSDLSILPSSHRRIGRDTGAQQRCHTR